jgi:hypothetical protein
VRVSPKVWFDTAGAADFIATQLTLQQLAPCINSTSATAPAFCTEFASPALCGSSTYNFSADGSNVPQCAGAGASMVLNVLNPETCVAGTPPAQYSADITSWLQEQMTIIAGTKWKNIVTKATQPDARQAPTVSTAAGVVLSNSVPHGMLSTLGTPAALLQLPWL